MKNYVVYVSVQGTVSIDVEAENQEEAEELALDRINDYRFNYGAIDINDDGTEVLSVDVIDND